MLSDGNQAEEKRGQFLGATLKSSGDRFLVRYRFLCNYGTNYVI